MGLGKTIEAGENQISEASVALGQLKEGFVGTAHLTDLGDHDGEVSMPFEMVTRKSEPTWMTGGLLFMDISFGR